MTPEGKFMADVLAVGGYGIYLYRLLRLGRANKGNRLIEFGLAAIILVFLIAWLMNVNGLPAWIVPSLGLAVLLFGFAALGVVFKRMVRAFRGRRRAD